MSPRFSIIIPTYNRAGSVCATLQSCFAQSLSDLEVLVVDDGSTDDTREVLAAIDDTRLVILHQANAGPAAARNHGMRMARGRHIAFLDSDDYWYPEFLEVASGCLERCGDVLLYGRIIVDRGVDRYWVKPSRGLAADESIYDYLYIHGNFIQTSTMVIPRSLVGQVSWDESVTFGDNDQFAIACWRTGIEFQMLPVPLTLYSDVISEHALSQLPIHAGKSEKYTNFFRWMATQQCAMSATAWAGFRARFESVSLARTEPARSLALLWQGYRAGAMGLSGMARQSVQNFFPILYRRLVDRYVKLRGLSLEQARGQ